MRVLNFVLKYALRIAIIAYLITANWRFLEIFAYLNAPKFWPLYWATCILVLIYMVIIESVYCVLILNHSKTMGGIRRSTRKVVFFVTGITIVTAINLVFLQFLLSSADHTFLTAEYFRSGFVFFLLVFMAYEAWVWYYPKTTLGFWVMERWVGGVVQGIEQKAKPYSPIYTEEEEVLIDDGSDIVVTQGVQLETAECDAPRQSFVAEVSIVLMDILLIISQRDGVYTYLRSGQRFFTQAKLAMLFNEEQLAWFAEYRKGARVNLTHLSAAPDSDCVLQLSDQYMLVLREVWKESALELDSFLTVSPVYIDRIEQQIENKEQLDKAVLSESIELKSVIENY